MDKPLAEIQVFADQLTKSLNALVEGVALVARDEVAELLSQYNALVPQLDQRLHVCAQLLEKGLRDEALGYEQDEPPLLTAVTLLDIKSRPQWPRWLQALKALGFPEPDMPKVEIAVELREAQDTLARLKPLLDQWRRHNLANSPLPARINVLRALKKQDPNNESWHDCLREHEKRRLMDIEASLASAISVQDEQRLTEMAADLAQEWLERPPVAIVKTVNDALAKIRGSRIAKEMLQVAEGLEAAHDAKDLDSASRLRDTWNSLIAQQTAFTTDDPAIARATPALDWLQWHERIAALHTEISQTLDVEPPTFQGRRARKHSLERMAYELEDLAEKLSGEIDPALIERLLSRVQIAADGLEREERGRRLRQYLAFGSAVAIVIALVAAFTNASSRNKQFAAAVEKVESLLARVAAGEDIEEVRSRLTWPEWLTADPQFSSTLAELDARITAEGQRRKTFTDSVQELSGNLDELAKLPAPESLDDWPPAFVAATQSLVRLNAAGVVKTPGEKADRERLAGRLENAAKRLQRATDGIFDGKVAELGMQIDQLRVKARSTPVQVAEQLPKIEARIQELMSTTRLPAAPGAAPPFADYRKVSRSAAATLDADGDLAKKINDLRQQLSQMTALAEKDRELTAAVGDWQQYAKLLGEISSNFPGQPVAREYGEAARDVEQWLAIDAWNAYLKTRPQFDALMPQAATEAVAELDDLRKTAAKLQRAVTFADEYEPLLKSIAERNLAEFATEIETWCGREWLGEVAWTIRDPATGTLWYAVGIKVPAISQTTFKYQRRWKAGDAWPLPVLEEKDPNANLAVEKSPQKRLAEKFETDLASKVAAAPGFTADKLLAEACKTLVDDTTVDPGVLIVNLRRFLQWGSGKELASPAFRNSKSITELTTRLDDGQGGIPNMILDEITEFLDPERKQNPQHLKVKSYWEKKVLGVATTAFSGLIDDIDKLQKKLEAPVANPIRCVGRLGRDQDGGITLQPRGDQPLSAGLQLQIMRRDGELATIGEVDTEGKPAWNGAAVLAGAPVFASSPPARAPNAKSAKPGTSSLQNKPSAKETP